MSHSLVLFDVDGTLIDTGGAGRRAIGRAFDRVFGLRDVTGPTSRVRLDGKTDPTILIDFAREAGLADGAMRERWAELLEAYLEALRDEMQRPHPRRRVLPGVPALLDALAGRPGVTVGLLTGNIEAGARVKLRAMGLEGYFAGGGFASDHADRAEIARLAREKLAAATGVDFPRERVTVVGDTELDVACARANGYRAVAVHSGWVPRERLEQAAPDALFDDLTDTGAVLAACRVPFAEA